MNRPPESDRDCPNCGEKLYPGLRPCGGPMNDRRRPHDRSLASAPPYPPNLRGVWWRIVDAVRGARYVKCNCGCMVYCGAGGPLEIWQCGACGRMLDAASQAASPNTLREVPR
jgi:hypothetical protein